MAHTLSLHAPAKVNLALSVGSPLPGGMHPIASWMVALTFSDALTLARHDDDTSTFDLAFADDAPAPPATGVNWPLEKDLVFRAHQRLEAHAQRKLPVRVTLRKRIPTGAGLGGGSSDAAAALVGLDRLLDLKLDRTTLIALGSKLGSDVGFLVGAMLGEPSALVAGLGERVEPAPRRQPIHLVLIFPGVDCPTGPVYQAFDQLHAGERREADAERVRHLVSLEPLPPDAPFNDLADAAMRVRPQLATWRDQLTRELNRPVHVTGSGSTLFVIATDEADAQRLAQRATMTSGLPALATRSMWG